jgi:hypothetical protein
LQIEVDKGEGYSTLAVVLQYEGVVNLAGITAGLKLPTGFEAQYPLTDDRHNFDIALSNYDGGIRPSQEVVLYFPINVLPNAPVTSSGGVPVLGPLALHFLRSANRSIFDSVDSSDQNLFAKALLGMNTNATSLSTGTTSTPGTTTTVNIPTGQQNTIATSSNGGISGVPLSVNSTQQTANLNDNLNFVKNNNNHFSRFIPFNFINQVIPVIFKVTGREVLDVYQGCTLNTNGTGCKIAAVTSTKGLAIPQTITFANDGDVPLYNLVVQFGTVLPVITGGSNNVVAPELPIVIQGPSSHYIPELAPRQTYKIPVYISSALNCNTNQALEADSSYNNIVGVRVEQSQVVGVTTRGDQDCPLSPGSTGTLGGSTKPLPPAITIGPTVTAH